MKIKELLQEGTKQLQQAGFEDSSIISRQLLKHILNEDNTYIVIHMEEEIQPKIQEKYSQELKKILEGMPLQYITHEQEFMGLKFYVDQNVLIPQPDTEILVEEVIKICKKMNAPIKILDLCTGSGAIAISLAKNLKGNTQIYASDISNKVLEIAYKNSVYHNVKINFINSDLFENIKEKFDIIVSNPPYIATSEIEKLSAQVQNEPKLALDGGKDGLEIYRRIVNDAYKRINNNGYICLEIGYNQRQNIIELLKEQNNIEKQNYYNNIYSLKDLSGNDRCVITQITNNNAKSSI